MRPVKGLLMVASLFVALITGAVLSAGITALAGQHSESQDGLAGAWTETITSTGPGSLPPFQTLFTYGSGGGLVGTASIDMTPGLKSSATHGAWTQLDGQRYRWTGHAFSFADTGEPNGTYNIKEHITLAASGNAYSGTGTFEIPGVFSLTHYTVTAVRIRPWR